MAQLPVMPLYTDALLGDTLHLSAAEFGVYILLLVAMWRSGGSLPDDDVVLRRIARTTANNWPRIRAAVSPLLHIEGGRISQKRLAAEFEKTAQRHARNVEKGRKGGKKRLDNLLTQREAGLLTGGEANLLPQEDTHSAPKSLENNDAPQVGLDAGSKQNTPPASSIHIHIQDREERETIVSPKKDASAKRGTRLAEDWKPSENERLWAASKGCSEARIAREAEAFRNFWIAKPGQGGVKLDWSATWRNWILNALERRPEMPAAKVVPGWSLPAQGPGRRA